MSDVTFSKVCDPGAGALPPMHHGMRQDAVVQSPHAYLTVAMRVVQALDPRGRLPSAASTRRRVQAAALETDDPHQLRLREKLERACGCTIRELAEAAVSWPEE